MFSHVFSFLIFLFMEMIISSGYDHAFSFSAAVQETTNITLYSTHPSIASPMLRTVRFLSFRY